MPSVKTLREKYTPKLAENHFNHVKEIVGDNALYILSDETTDRLGRCVFVILFRVFAKTFETPKLVVASVNFLQKADATTCAQVITQCINMYGIQYHNIMGLISDSARYMTKCVTSLQVLFGEHVEHIQCWAHKLSIVGNVVSSGLSEVNCAVVNVKSAFLNTRKRKHQYLKYLEEETSQTAKLFPMPVVTRWNSWFESVFYLAEYFLHIVEFFRGAEYQEVSNAGIKYLTALSDKDAKVILAQCTFIKCQTPGLVKTLKKLEGGNYPTAHTLYNDVECILNDLDCISKGVFSSDFESATSKLSTREDAHVRHECQKTAALAMNKLQGLLNSDPSAATFKALKLFNPKDIILNQSENIIPLLKTIPELKEFDKTDLFKGYQALKEIVQDTSKTENHLDIVKILIALSVNYHHFALAALQAVWRPTNNVDSERLLSHYNLVVTDRRNGLKEANVEILTMLSFED